MIGVKSYADKATDAVVRAEAALARMRRMLADHDTAKPAGDDADKLFVWRRERRDIEDRVGAAEEALTYARQAAARAVEQAEKAAADRAHAELAKRAAAGIKLVHKILNAAEQMAVDLEELKQTRNAISEANKVRAGRKPIADPEFEVRQRPGVFQKGLVRYDTVWVDAAGEVVKAEICDRRGDYIRNPAAVRQIQKPYATREEYTLPPTMPSSLAEEVRLVNLQGQQIWPLRPTGAYSNA